jgi:molybdopterin synthase sulfur carrier subunit
MTIDVRIPPPFQSLTGDREVVEAAGATVGELIEDLERNHPGIEDHLCDENGEVWGFVNIYVNLENIRSKEGKNTILKEGDEVSIVPAVAGG